LSHIEELTMVYAMTPWWHTSHWRKQYPSGSDVKYQCSNFVLSVNIYCMCAVIRYQYNCNFVLSVNICIVNWLFHQDG
jgi:hypothetical protein